MIYRIELPMEGELAVPVGAADGEIDYEMILLDSKDLGEYEGDIRKWFATASVFLNERNEMNLCKALPEDLRKNLREAVFTLQKVGEHLYGRMEISLGRAFSQGEYACFDKSLHQFFKEGWGERLFSAEEILVQGGCLQIWMKYSSNLPIQELKYQITEIAHPRYPWLHRLRALRQVNEQVMPGTLGGYVQTEGNLSHDGSCWIYDDAVSCEGAVVENDARMYDGAVARDFALVGGDARMFEQAKAEGHSSILSGELKEDARMAGEAVIKKSHTGEAPLIGRGSNIYGTVCGWFVINDNVLPGEKLINHTRDMIVLENGKREVLVKQRKLKPPVKNQQRADKAKDRER